MLISYQDAYLTPSLGMDTTCGSLALKGQIATRDAAAVEQLRRAGMIVIAKANMSVSEVAVLDLWHFAH